MDSWIKGIRNFDVEVLWKALLEQAKFTNNTGINKADLINYLKYGHCISDKGAPSVKFSSIVSSSSDLCSALNSFKAVNWLEIKKEDKDHFFYGSCYSQQGSHRSIVREHKVGSVVSYQLFSCVVDDDKKCPFEKE